MNFCDSTVRNISDGDGVMVTKFHDGNHLSTTFASAKRLLNDLQRLLLNFDITNHESRSLLPGVS